MIIFSTRRLECSAFVNYPPCTLHCLSLMVVYLQQMANHFLHLKTPASPSIPSSHPSILSVSVFRVKRSFPGIIFSSSLTLILCNVYAFEPSYIHPYFRLKSPMNILLTTPLSIFIETTMVSLRNIYLLRIHDQVMKAFLFLLQSGLTLTFWIWSLHLFICLGFLSVSFDRPM